MGVPTCLNCNAPFHFEGEIGANSISVNKVCNCLKTPVQPMPDAVATLNAIREFHARA